ncbi:release factor glutamine methyltransferase [Paenibacillus turicensis]|uniref:Release factor glutamine methyltransferase n=2 Tax=Paenibacillus turicensis TaxID=160487 RepID=A0ABS4FWH7_9BACL|nr:release factor glutamine methyltransferase [Paenibacillus turicensis]
MNDCRYMLSDSLNIAEARNEASSFLERAGVSEAKSNVELLLRHVLGLSGAAYLAALRDPFPQDKAALWQEVIERKAKGEPAQYIIGEQEFYGLPFKVTPAVLIPRPETELLVEAVIEAGDEVWSRQRSSTTTSSSTLREVKLDQFDTQLFPKVVDIGTGSGAIAAAVKHLRPQWQVEASDISPEALQVARENVATLGLDVSFRQGDLLAPFTGEMVDIVISNPPYIPASDMEELQPEVRDYEPRGALDGGDDGLNPYRIMMEQLPLLAQPPKVIGFELGMGQAGEVAELLKETGLFREIRIIRDLADIERHVIGLI